MIRSIQLLFFVALLPFSSAGHGHDDRFYRFIPNRGQFEEPVRYKADINGGVLFLEKDAFTFHFVDYSAFNKLHVGKLTPAEDIVRAHAYKMRFVNSSVLSLTEEHKTSDYYNYYLGDDQSKWAGGVFAYQEITYHSLYPGIDLQLYSKEEQLKYDYIIQPGADPAMIQQQYDGVSGIKLKNGNLIIQTSLITITEMKPVAHQVIDGKKVNVRCEFFLNGTLVTYRFPDGYDKKQTLIIDPTLVFASYTGSTADNFGMTATYDSQGHLFTGGMAYNVGFPVTVGAFQTTTTTTGSTGANYGITDVVITKFTPNGSNLVYSTYIGGGTSTNGTETAHSLIVNENDELFLFGVTSSANFPTTTGAYDETFNGGTFVRFDYNGTRFDNGTDIYVSKFNVDGTALLGSTFVGGTANDGVNNVYTFMSGGNSMINYDSLTRNYGDQFRGEVMVDDLGNCYIASTTRSADFPIAGGFQSAFNGMQDAVVFKMNPDLTNLEWSTFLGGSNKDAAYSIKVDENYNSYVAGGTVSSNFPSTAGALSTVYTGGTSDGFVCKISADGSTLLASTYLGTNLYDQVFFVEVDRFGEIYLLGQTMGTGTWPVINAIYSNPNSGQFVTKLDNGLTTILYSTVFGNGNGNINISPSAFLVDVCGNIYVSGWGGNIITGPPMTGMPTTFDAIQPTSGDGYNFYLIVFSQNINALLYASYFGGNLSSEHVDGGTSRFDKFGIVYQSVCAGCGNSNDDFPTTPGAWSNTNNSTNCNNGVFKYDFNLPLVVAGVSAPPTCISNAVVFNNTSIGVTDYWWSFGDGDTSTSSNPTHVYPAPGTYTVTLAVSNPGACNFADTTTFEVTILNDTTIILPPVSLCPGETEQLGVNPVADVVYSWTPPTYLDDPAISNPFTTPSASVNYTLLANNGVCTDTMLQQVTVNTVAYTISNDTMLCNPNGTPIPIWINPSAAVTNILWADNSSFTNPISPQGSATVNIIPDSTSWYYVQFTYNGCLILDSVLVEVNPSIIDLVPLVTICSGDSAIITAINTSGGSVTYDWFPDTQIISGDGTATVEVEPSATTWIYLTATNSFGCMTTDSVQVVVSQLPNLTVIASSSSDSVYSGGTVQLFATPNGPYSYSWTPVASLSNPNIQNPFANPTSTTIYTVSVSENGMCTRQDTVIIYIVDVICEEPYIYIPNAFTPNGDGANDILFVRGGMLTEITFRVYNRWGEKVFESYSLNSGWDGTFNGRDCDPAVFDYYLEATCPGGETFFKKGNVTLIR
jgi:gliding motility-associated-like protein